MPDPWVNVLPPDTRAVGTGNPPLDFDAVDDAVAALGAGLNVLNPVYGAADPNGVVDSTSAFQACITAAVATGAEMTIPPGTYNLHTGGLQITGPLKIRGLGACLSNTNGFFLTAAVTLNCDGGGAGTTNMFTFPYQGYLWGGLEIQGLNINYSGTGNVFHQVNFTDFAFKDMVITITGSAAMAFFTSGTNSLLSGLFERVNCVTTNSVRSNPMMSIVSSNSGAISNNTHFKCKFTNAGFDNSQTMVLYSCTAAGNGFHYSDNFRECWFEHPYGGAYKSLSGMGITVDGCSIWDAFPNSGQSSTVAAASNGGQISLVASWAFPSAGVLAVASTTGFPSSGTLLVATSTTTATVTYTGVTPTTFTGCAYVSGSATGTVATGGSVSFSVITAKSYYYVGAAAGNSGSTGTKITGCSRNRGGPNGTTCWDVETEATSSQTQVEGYTIKPDTASTYTPLYLNFNGSADTLELNNQSPQGSTVNGNSDTVVTNPSPTGARISRGLITPIQEPLWTPADSGWLESNCDWGTALASATALLTSGGVYLIRVPVRMPRLVTNVILPLGTLGTTLTSGQSFAGLVASTGVPISTSADQSAAWQTGGGTGVKVIAQVSGPFLVQPPWVWVAVMSNWTGTAPAFGRCQNFSASIANAGVAASAARWALGNVTGTTAIPTITPGSNTIQQASYGAAIS